MEAYIKKGERTAIFFLLYSLIFYLFFITLKYTLPFVLGIIFALICRKPAYYLTMTSKIKPWLASLLSSIVFFIILIGTIFLCGTAIINETVSLTKFIPEYIGNLANSLYDNLMKLNDTFIINIDSNILSSLESSISDAAASVVATTVNLSTLIIQKILAILGSVPYIAMVIIFTLLATYYITLNLISPHSKNILKVAGIKVHRTVEIALEMRKMIFNFSLSYLLIVFITFLATLIGFTILRIPYAFLLSLLCGIFDIMPILGMAIVYIPLALINFLQGNYFTGLALLILWIVVMVVRQIIEPKIMSTTLGLNPLAVLAAIFIGIEAGGVLGMLFFMFLVVFYTVLNELKVI